jgi:hypothetical protein
MEVTDFLGIGQVMTAMAAMRGGHDTIDINLHRV